MKLFLTVFVCMLAVSTATATAPSTALFNAFQLEAAQSEYEQILSMHSRIMTAFKPQHLNSFSSQMRLLKDEVAVAEKERSDPIDPSVLKACKDAIKAIDDSKNATACKTFDKFDPEKATPAQYASVCESSCMTSVQTALTAAGNACAANITNRGVLNKLNEIKAETTGLCIKENNEYCMVKFLNATGEIGKLSKNKKGTYTITEAQLNSVCSPCANKVMAAMAASGDAMGEIKSAVNTFKMLCVKDQGKFCYTQVVDMDAQTKTGAVNYEAICSPCFRKYAMSSGEFSPETFNQYGQFCLRDETGKLCLEKYAEFGTTAASALLNADCVQGIIAAAAAGTSTDMCQVSACVSALNKAVSDMGCCFGTLIKFDSKEKSGKEKSAVSSSTGAAAPAVPAVPVPVSPDAATPIITPIPEVPRIPIPSSGAKATEPSTPESIAKTFCLSSVPSGCKGSSKNVKLTFTIPNLSWSWYSASAANKQKADDAVRQDLATAAGVVPSAVTLTSKQSTTTTAAKFRFMATSSGVTYDSTIAVDTDAQADFVTSDMKSQASAGTLAFSTTASSLPTESKNNAAQSYEVSSVTAETTSTGAAASISVSIGTIIAVLIAIVINQ